MKHLSGEKTGSKAVLLKNSFILIFLILPTLSFSQVPINGFCYRNDFSIPQGYTGIFSADLNSNNSSELILYSPALKRIGIYSGIVNDSSIFKELQVKTEISQLRLVKNVAGFKNLFAAVERKQRKVSFFSIYVDSLSEKVSEISFDSYPEKIITGDVDLNGNDEILVYGSAFDGLSMIYRADGGIGERKISPGTSFSEAVFIDFNDDGYTDVVAFDILDYSLRLFKNNTKGIFREVRTIPCTEKISLLKSYDFNRDGIEDIIYVVQNQIEILFGDFQSAFKKKISLKLEGDPASVQIGDYNRDKIPDIAYLLLNNSLSIIFGKNGQQFYEPIPYLKNSSILTFTRFTDGASTNLACITGSGELIVISAKEFTGSDANISVAIEADALNYFDFGNDGIPDIAFIDNYDNLLKLLVNTSAAFPLKFYSIPLAEDHSKILIDEFSSNRKIFYCYSNGTPLLEVFRYNFKTDRLNRKQLYAPGEILDVYFKRIDSSFVNIYVLYNKKSKMYLGRFENRDVSITFKEYPVIDRNVIDAKLFVEDEPVIYYWKSENNTFDFNTVTVKTGPNEETTNMSILNSSETKINLYGADRFDNEYPFLVSLVQSQTENQLIVISAGKISSSKLNIKSPESKKAEFGEAFFGETSIKGINNFTVNSLNDNYIYKLVYRQTDGIYFLNQLVAAENVSDYFITRLDRKNYYLVYSNKEKGCISIRSLKK